MQDPSNPAEAYNQMHAASCSRQQCNQDLVAMIKEQSICDGSSGMVGWHSCNDRLNWVAIMARLGQTPQPTGPFLPVAVICAVLVHGFVRS